MPKRIDVPLSLFSGTNSELAPVDIPEGVSPDNQDMIFLPGSTESRDGTHKIYSDVLANTPTIVYCKPFVQPNGLPLTLLLDSNGILYHEDVFNAPGVRTQIGSVTPGARAFSCTAEGVEYISFHDGAHGLDVPRQLNGGFLDRISQDGPAAPPTATNYAAVLNLANPNGIVPQFATVNISAALENGNIVTITTATPHGLFPDEEISVQGVAGAYSGIWSVLAAPDQFTFTYFNPTAGLAPQGAAGTVRPVTVVVATTTPHGMISGAQFTIKGSSAAAYNNNVAGNPVSWTLQTVNSPTSFTFVPGVDPMAGNGGTMEVGGQISEGVHKVVQMFLLRSGHITRPSQPASWISTGGKMAQISDLAIGPANCVGRILAFTGADGGFYFYVPDATTGSMAMIIPDNVTTSIVLDFADTTLFNATGIDIDGNNLFALHTLRPCLGLGFYASRLWAWRELNTVERFVNMGFEGGTLGATPTVPLGWNAAADGALVASPADYGDAWQITGDGTANPRGLLTQSGYQDYLNQPILKGSTQYTFYAWAKSQLAGQAGNLVAEIYSPGGGGVLATATIPLNTIPASGKFKSADFNALTPAVIPADCIIRIYGVNLANGQTCVIDELNWVFTAQPYREGVFRVSYVDDFEAFDANTGTLGPTDDPNPIMCMTVLRGTMYFQTTERLHQTRDNGLTEPWKWNVDQVANVGAMSVDAMSPVSDGEDWFFTMSNGASGRGLYISDGGGPHKISQEYQTWFDAINTNAQSTGWLVNDSTARRCYMGVPNGSADFPNLILVMDYRELDQPSQISTSSPIHISFTGKMIASDLVRKWTRWNLTANCGSIITRPGGGKQFVIGAGNGQALGAAPGFGNVYYFDTAKLTDDDYGQINPYYWTYFFVNHEMEQALQLGSHRKSFSYLTARVVGTGNLQITPAVNELSNAQRGLRACQLTSTLVRDIERRLQISGERCAFKHSVTPLSGQTDVKMKIQRLVVTLQEESLTPIAGPR
jgi:hypothetical protein